eukprot:SAG31_NODE_727_length_12536_cov_2.306022_2_plen_841_part_00
MMLEKTRIGCASYSSPNRSNDHIFLTEMYCLASELMFALNVQVSGFCQVQLEYLPHPKDPDDFPDDSMPEPEAMIDDVADLSCPADLDPYKLMRLEVLIFEAQALPRMEIVGKNDPYAAIRLDGFSDSVRDEEDDERCAVKRTKTVEGGGKNPKWSSRRGTEAGELVAFELRRMPSAVVIQVFDEEMDGADRLIGECAVDLGMMSHDTDWDMHDWFSIRVGFLIPLFIIIPIHGLTIYRHSLQGKQDEEHGTLNAAIRWIMDPPPPVIDENEADFGDISVIKSEGDKNHGFLIPKKKATDRDVTDTSAVDGEEVGAEEVSCEEGSGEEGSGDVVSAVSGNDIDAGLSVAEERARSADWTSILGGNRVVLPRSSGRRTPIVHRAIVPDNASQESHPDVVALSAARAASIMVAGSQLHSQDVSSVHTAKFNETWNGADKVSDSLQTSQGRKQAQRRWQMHQLFGGRVQLAAVELQRIRKELSVQEMVEEHTQSHRKAVKPHRFVPVKHDGYALCGGCAVLMVRLISVTAILSGLWLWLAILCAGAGHSFQCWTAHGGGMDNHAGGIQDRPQWDFYSNGGFAAPVTDVLIFHLLAQLLAAATSKFPRLLLPGTVLCAVSCVFATIKIGLLSAEVMEAEGQAKEADTAVLEAVARQTAADEAFSIAAAANFARFLTSNSASESWIDVDTPMTINETEALQLLMSLNASVSLATANVIEMQSLTGYFGPIVSDVHWILLLSAAIAAFMQLCLLGCTHWSARTHAKWARKAVYSQGFTHAQQQQAFAELEQSNLKLKPYQFAKFRLWLKIVVTSATFEWFILIVVLLESVALASFNPYARAPGSKS